jgi:hypothetical protein
MAITTIRTVTTVTALTSAGVTEVTFPRSSTDYTVTIGAIHQSLTLAVSTTDQVLDIADLAAFRFLAIYSDAAISIQVASGDTGTVIPIEAGGCRVIPFTGDQTAIYLTNGSGTVAAHLDVIIAK